MYRTEVGYAGGTTPSPTYRTIGDHAEAVQLHFDPTAITYEALLELFWDSHHPFSSSLSQYRAELFCADDEQWAAATASAERLSAEHGDRVLTRITRNATFYPAEAYHQKWRLRKQPALFDELSSHYDSEAQVLASTAAAKLNAYAGGNWKPTAQDLDALGVALTDRRTNP